MKTHHFSFASVLVLGLFLLAPVAQAATLYSQTIGLASGWNIVSTPKVLDSHSFSATENSTNFDIYALDPSKPSGWATLADLGQTEFTPLYGYFINNKTGSTQTLTLNYKADTTPNQRLFERVFSTTGWYSFGVANSSYVLPVNTATSTDSNNPGSILSALVVGSTSGYDSVVDFTHASSTANINGVALADPWKSVVQSAINTLNDFRETKGYAIYIKQANALYTGLQDNSVPAVPQCADGLDNDSDGSIDYPADAGCSSLVDNSEDSNVIVDANAFGNASEVPAQNIAINVSNQVLGGFFSDFTGEAVSITGLKVTFATSTAATGLLTNVSLVDQNGSVIAGPVDTTFSNGTMTATFTDTVTLPTGHRVYSIKGKVPSAAVNGAIITASTNPSSWSNPTGQTSGNSVTIGTGSFSMNSMTVKGGALTVSMSSSPASQNIVAGSQSVLLGQVLLDASLSGEDVRMSSIKLTQTGTITNLSTCQLFNGSTALNTGSNVQNSLAASGSDTNFTLDNSLIIPKGTVTTIGIKCNVASNATGSHVWSISGTDLTATGVTSGASINVNETASSGGTMTIASASLALSVDSSSPSYALAAGGTTGMTMGVYKFRATNEAISLTKVGLTLTSGSASDVVQVYLYSGATLVGTATFTGSNTAATSTLSTPVTLAKDTDVTIIVKADLADVGTSQPGTEGALIKIDPSNAQGSGMSSGVTINTGATGNVSGVRLLNTYPTLSNAGVFCSNSTACNGTNQVLKKFSITANSADALGLYQISASIATSSASATNLKLIAYTDSGYSNPATVSGTTGGQFGTTQTPNSNTYTAVFTQTTPLQVSAGTTLYFAVVADVVPGSSATTWAISATVLGDSAFDGMKAAASVSGNFIWSPNATSVSTAATTDWTNGYGVPGLSSSGF